MSTVIRLTYNSTMRKFGRYDCGKAKPVEVYEGDRMELGRGYVTIVEGGYSIEERLRPERARDKRGKE